jgi:hypothetical protein
MMLASTKTVAHVPCFGSLSIDREPVAIRTCARRWRAHSNITKRTTPPATRSASHLLPAGGKLRTAIERTPTLSALAVRPFISRGLRLICNFCRRLAGSSFNPRVKFCQEPARSIFHTLFFPPVLSPVPVFHANQHGASGLKCLTTPMKDLTK